MLPCTWFDEFRLGIETMTIAIGILLLEVGVAIHLLVYTMITGISPIPTSPLIKAKMLEAVPKDVQGTILDLGSGWGNLVFAFAKKYPQSRVIGYELSPIPWCFCRVRQWLKPQLNVEFRRRDYRKVPLDQADLVVCYLFPRGMRELRSKFEHELNTGCLIISNTFAMPGWRPDHIYVAEDQYATQVFVYELPAEAALSEAVVSEFWDNDLVW